MKRIMERKLEKDSGRRLGGLLFESKLGKDKGRRLGGLASLGPLGARLFGRSFEANFSYGHEKLEEKKRTERRKK